MPQQRKLDGGNSDPGAISRGGGLVDEPIREIRMWLRFQNMPRLREVLIHELDTVQRKVAYDLTDGQHSRREIAARIGVPDETIRNWWDKWYQLAIVGPTPGVRGRPTKLVSLDDVGIVTPKLPGQIDATTVSGDNQDESEESEAQRLGVQGDKVNAKE